MPLTADRNTPYKPGSALVLPAAGGVEIFAGALVVADANGYVAPGTTATGLTYLGRADEHVDNTGGANGDATVNVLRGVALKFKNSDADPVTQASLGKPCYIVDDETVAGTDGAATRSEAGKVVGIDSDGVWVL